MFELMNQTFCLHRACVFLQYCYLLQFHKVFVNEQRSNQPNEDEVATSEALLVAQQA